MAGAKQLVVVLAVDDSARQMGADLRIRDQFALRRADGDARILVRRVAKQDRPLLFEQGGRADKLSACLLRTNESAPRGP